MKRQLALAAVVVLLSACGEIRVTTVPWPVDPGRLAAFIGTWSVEGEMQPGNVYGAPAGRHAYRERYEWRPGEFLVKVTRTGEGSGQPIRHDLLMGYQITTGQYSFIGSDLSSGALASGTGTNNGNVWTFVSLAQLGAGRYVHERCSLTFTSERSYTLSCEMSPDSRTWTPAFEARATRS